MKSYTITVNGNVYDVTVEENGAVSAPAAAPRRAAAPAPAAAPKAAAPAGGRGNTKDQSDKCRPQRLPQQSCRTLHTVRPATPGTRGGRYHRAIIRGLEQAEAHTAKHQSPSDVHIGGLPRQ